MILFIEQLLIHGAFIFMNLTQALYEFSAFLFCEISTEEEHKKSSVSIEKVNSAEDCIPLWGLPVINKELAKQEYVPTFLTDEQDDYFASLIDCINSTEEEILEEVQGVAQAKVDDSILTMDSWQGETEPVAVTTTLAATANAKITDSLIGEQLWVVEVIGEEQEYLHVSDGSGRAWINAENFGQLGKRDILSVLVHRQSDLRVELVAVEVLQRHSSEFSLLDEYYNTEFNEYSTQEISVGA